MFDNNLVSRGLGVVVASLALALFPAVASAQGTTASVDSLSTQSQFSASGSDSDSDSGNSDSGNSDSGNSSDSNSDSGNSSDSNSDSGQSSGDSSNDTSASSGSSGDGGGNPDENPDEEEQDTATDSRSSSDSSGTFMAITSLGLTAGLVVSITVVAANASKKSAALEVYLRQNSVAFQSDVSTGAGSVVADLRSFFGIADENRAEFARILREIYPRLRPIVDEVGTEEDATEQFIRTVVDAMRRSPALERDLADAGFLRPTLHLANSSSNFS